jgi:hypothetical protein
VIRRETGCGGVPARDARFLPQLTGEGGLQGFARLDMAAQDIPAAGVGLVRRSPTQEHGLVADEDGPDARVQTVRSSLTR